MISFHLILIICPAEPRFILFWKPCRSRSAGYWQSHLIRIHTSWFSMLWKYMLWFITGMLQVNRIKIGRSDLQKIFSMKSRLPHTLRLKCSFPTFCLLIMHEKGYHIHLKCSFPSFCLLILLYLHDVPLSYQSFEHLCYHMHTTQVIVFETL